MHFYKQGYSPAQSQYNYQNQEICTDTVLHLVYRLVQALLIFLLIFVLAKGSHSELYVAFTCRISLVFFILEQFLHLFLTFIILTLTKITEPLFYRMPLNLGLSVLLRLDTYRLYTWVEISQKSCSLLSIRWYTISVYSIIGDFHFDYLLDISNACQASLL